MKKIKNSLWGIVLILLGVLVALKAFGVEIDIFFDGFWTLFIIIPCLIGLLTEQDKKGNLIGLLIGVALLLACLDVISFQLIGKLIVPVVLVVIGFSLIFKDALGKKINEKVKKLREKTPEDATYGAFFSGENMNVSGAVFQGAELNAVFGGYKLDLRDAEIKEDVAVQASAIFGGIDIYVPENVNVRVQATSIFGGVSGARNKTVSETAQTIYIKATCLFGGVTIK